MTGLALVVSGVLVSGCETTGTGTTSEGNVTRTVSAQAGKKVSLGASFNVNPDCSAGKTSLVKIASNPSHGTASLASISGYPDFPKGEPRYKCNTRRVPKTAVYYTPAPGFIGSDSVGIATKSPSASTFNQFITIRIDVTK